MQFRLGVLIGLLAGITLASLYHQRKRQAALPAQPVDENAKWDNRIDELHSFYSEEKAHSRLGRR